MLVFNRQKKAEEISTQTQISCFRSLCFPAKNLFLPTATVTPPTQVHKQFSNFLEFWPKHAFYLFSLSCPAIFTVKEVQVLDYSLPELKVVKLDINVVLNVLTQTRSLVASRLIRDDTHWDRTAQGTGNTMKNLQFMATISKSSLTLQTSSATLLRSTSSPSPGQEHSVLPHVTTEALLSP